MWVLFFLLITSPGAYEVNPLNTYKGDNAEVECKAKSAEIMDHLKTVYTHKTEQNTYIAVCLKQLEIEA